MPWSKTETRALWICQEFTNVTDWSFIRRPYLMLYASKGWYDACRPYKQTFWLTTIFLILAF